MAVGAAGVTIKKVLTFTIAASGDLSSYQYHPMDLDSNGQAALPTTVGQKVVGVLLNKPDTKGDPAELLVIGRCPVKAGAAVSAKDYLSVEVTTGRGIQAAAAGYHVFAMALEAGVDGDLVDCLVNCIGNETNAADA